jgi:hypothetical protein
MKFGMPIQPRVLEIVIFSPSSWMIRARRTCRTAVSWDRPQARRQYELPQTKRPARGRRGGGEPGLGRVNGNEIDEAVAGHISHLWRGDPASVGRARFPSA